MDITILRYDNKFCGAYLDNGILFDAREGVGQALKEHGLQPKTVFLTANAGVPVSGLAELEGVPIGNVGLDESCKVSQFPVGTKGSRKYGYRVETPDGKFVYAPEFDRLEKSKIAGVDLAVLDPGDRTEVGEPTGLSHKAFGARERMAANAGITQTLWTDTAEGTLSVGKQVYSGTSPDMECAEDDPDCVKKKKDMTKAIDIPVVSEKSVDLDQQIQAISDAFREYDFGLPVATGNSYIVKNYDDAIVVCFYDYDYERQYYRIGYSRTGDSFTFDKPASWTKVEMTASFTPVGKSQFIVEKEEQTGKFKYWTAISSSDFKDTDGETVSTMAMDFAIAVAQKRGEAGNLVWDHYDELPIGVCKSQTRVGKFLVETGEFFDTPLAQKAAAAMKSAQPGKYRVSIGFNYWQGTKSDDGTYHLIDIFHRAVTDHPANAATSIEVTKSMKTFTPEVLANVQKEIGLTDAEMSEVMEAVSKANHKEEKAETTAVPVMKSEADKTPDPAMADVVKQLADLNSAFQALKAQTVTATDLKDKFLAALKDVPSGDITRPSQAAKELTEDEKAKVETAIATKEEKTKDRGFQAIYQMFQSPAKA